MNCCRIKVIILPGGLKYTCRYMDARDIGGRVISLLFTERKNKDKMDDGSSN